MRNHSHLSIDRPVHSNDTSRRFTAKLEDLALTTLGHDGSSIAGRPGEIQRTIGNPRHRLLAPLLFNLVYKAGIVDGRNKRSSFGLASDQLEESEEFRTNLRQLYRQYDGIDPHHLGLYFDTLAFGDKPGYETGELQMILLPSAESLEAGILARESQVCLRGLQEVAPLITRIEGATVSGIPIIRLRPDFDPDKLATFVEKCKKELLPVRLELDAITIEGIDRRSNKLASA